MRPHLRVGDPLNIRSAGLEETGALLSLEDRLSLAGRQRGKGWRLVALSTQTSAASLCCRGTRPQGWGPLAGGLRSAPTASQVAAPSLPLPSHRGGTRAVKLSHWICPPQLEPSGGLWSHPESDPNLPRGPGTQRPVSCPSPPPPPHPTPCARSPSAWPLVVPLLPRGHPPPRTPVVPHRPGLRSCSSGRHLSTLRSEGAQGTGGDGVQGGPSSEDNVGRWVDSASPRPPERSHCSPTCRLKIFNSHFKTRREEF